MQEFEILKGVEMPPNGWHKKTTRSTAKENGETFYFTGKPCRNGHLAKRWVSIKRCVECDKERKATVKGRYKKTKRDWQLKFYYGLTRTQYDQMVSHQNGLCVICKSELSHGKTTHIDHCKITRKIRGILCSHCNVGIGHLKHNVDILRAAILYCEQTNDNSPLVPRRGD